MSVEGENEAAQPMELSVVTITLSAQLLVRVHDRTLKSAQSRALEVGSQLMLDCVSVIAASSSQAKGGSSTEYVPTI
eukprot:scaffold188195_cov17-Prasinocladus_malaysianus.AAC.1